MAKIFIRTSDVDGSVEQCVIEHKSPIGHVTAHDVPIAQHPPAVAAVAAWANPLVGEIRKHALRGALAGYGIPEADVESTIAAVDAEKRKRR